MFYLRSGEYIHRGCAKKALTPPIDPRDKDKSTPSHDTHKSFRIADDVPDLTKEILRDHDTAMRDKYQDAASDWARQQCLNLIQNHTVVIDGILHGIKDGVPVPVMSLAAHIEGTNKKMLDDFKELATNEHIVRMREQASKLEHDSYVKIN